MTFTDSSEDIIGWRYYNGAALPTCQPHEKADISAVKDGFVWKLSGRRPLFARWTSDFDCVTETGWYWCIKDTLYDIDTLNSSKRYEIRKGRKNFRVELIEPKKYAAELAFISRMAFECYPSLYKPKFNERDFINSILYGAWDNKLVFMAFEKITDKPSAYTVVILKGKTINLSQQKAIPYEEKRNVNFALLDYVNSYFNDYLIKGYYLVDGERNIVHQTNFQDFLCKYFGYRKANCRLNMAYPSYIKLLINFLWLFRSKFVKYKAKNSLIYKIYCVLKMEEIARNNNKNEHTVS